MRCEGRHGDPEPGLGPDRLPSYSRNLYEGLRVEEAQEESEALLTKPQTACAECQVDVSPKCPGPLQDVRIADDELGIAIEYASALQELYDVVQAVDSCWKQAGRGDVHLVSAAFATHVGYASILQIVTRLLELDEGLSIVGLQQKCCNLANLSADGPATADWHSLLEQLATTQSSIEHHTSGHKNASTALGFPAIQKPADFLQGTASVQGGGPQSLQPALIENVIHLIRSKQFPTSIVRNSTPVYADFGYLMAHPQDNHTKLHVTLSLHLLSQGYHSYVRSLQQPSTAGRCRLTALRLAHSAASSVSKLLEDKNCFPCRCAQTLAFHLHNAKEDLASFASHNRWDYYFQSPYVSGSHILEILALCQYYGSKLFVYRHYIGALVHSYNVLRQLAGLEEIPLLEYLCDTFKDSFFPGGHRPTRSFRACWTRYIGARLKFRKGHRRNHKDSWCMAIPPHAARKAAGLGVGGGDSDSAKDDKGENFVFRIKQQDYDISDAQWAKLAEAEPAVAGNNNRPKQHRIETLLPLLEKNLTSTPTDPSPPTARLNHFAVFHDCVRVVAGISDATHTSAAEQGMNCICFAGAILEGGDRIVAARSMGRLNDAGGVGGCWRKEETEGVIKTTTDRIRDVLGGRDAGQWGWEL